MFVLSPIHLYVLPSPTACDATPAVISTNKTQGNTKSIDGWTFSNDGWMSRQIAWSQQDKWKIREG